MSMPALLAETERVHRELPVEPIVFGIVTLVMLLVLLWVVTRFNPDR